MFKHANTFSPGDAVKIAPKTDPNDPTKVSSAEYKGKILKVASPEEAAAYIEREDGSRAWEPFDNLSRDE